MSDFSLDSILEGPPLEAPLIAIHGEAGVGKTTFAAGAPSPIFVPFEKGVGMNKAPTFPLVKSFEDLKKVLTSLKGDGGKYKTVVFDTLTSLQDLLEDYTCRSEGKASMADFDFGKGHVKVGALWTWLFKEFETLRSLGKAIILIAHSQTSVIDPPNGTAYTRFDFKLDKRGAGLLAEKVDLIGFAYISQIIDKQKEGDRVGKEVDLPIVRNLKLSPSAGVLAKNRFRLTGDIPLEWGVLESKIPFYNNNLEDEK